MEDGSGLVPLSRTLAIVLALEREFDAAELQALVEQLSPSDNGALDFLGLCEVVCTIMRGGPRTSDSLTLVDRTGKSTTVTLQDVAALQLKALYSIHTALDDQKCWLKSEGVFGPHTVCVGEGLASAYTHQKTSFTIQARDWLHHDLQQGGDVFEVRIRGNQSTSAEVVDHGDGTYTATYSVGITGVYALHVTHERKHVSGSPFALLVDPDATQPLLCFALFARECL